MDKNKFVHGARWLERNGDQQLKCVPDGEASASAKKTQPNMDYM